MLLALGGAPPASAAGPVQRVDIRLTIEGGDPHPLVVQRISESVASAAERLLVGRDSEVVARQAEALAAVLREVTDRVVRGYRTTALSFQAGATTVVAIRLQPRAPILEELLLVVTMPGVHVDAQPLVRAVLDPSVPTLRRLAVGVPAEALEWAGPLLERQMVDTVERTVPGFTGTARIVEDGGWRIALTLAARDARVIRDIGVRFRSSSIPFVLLQGHGPQVVSMAEPLRGLPVAFATAQRGPLQGLIAGRLAAYPPVREYHVVARPVLDVAEVTYVTVVADSTLYRARLEARLNFGTGAPASDVRAQIGRAFGSLEPFAELTLVPTPLALRVAVGARFDLGTHLTIGAKTNVEGSGLEPFLSYRLSPDMALHGRYVPSSTLAEATLTYRLNEFLSWEGVATSTGLVWIRLVSNL